MIDLHLHFDGSLLPKTVIELAKEQQIKLPAWEPEELKAHLTVPQDCENLEDYLACFDLPLLVLQTKEGIRKAMYTSVCSLKEQGLLYVEIRFTPQLHTNRGLSQEEVVQAAARGMQEALAGSYFKAGLILCCMRGSGNQKENMETVETAARFLGRGVVAIDIAGEEEAYPLEQFEELFVRARELGVPYTIHAGEEEGPEGIRTAVRFGAKRIGHGVNTRQEPGLAELLIKEGVTLESCPTSNLQTRSIASIEEHPVLDYLRQGIKVTLNTDNMTVSDTTLEKEFRQLEDHLGLTREEKRQMLFNSADAAFLSAEEKGRLKDVISKII